jgi:hypothetical protein
LKSRLQKLLDQTPVRPEVASGLAH